MESGEWLTDPEDGTIKPRAVMGRRTPRKSVASARGEGLREERKTLALRYTIDADDEARGLRRRAGRGAALPRKGANPLGDEIAGLEARRTRARSGSLRDPVERKRVLVASAGRGGRPRRAAERAGDPGHIHRRRVFDTLLAGRVESRTERRRFKRWVGRRRHRPRPCTPCPCLQLLPDREPCRRIRPTFRSTSPPGTR